jgi:hypothetical protein
LATNPATAADLQHRSIKTLSANEVTVGGYLLTDAWNILLASRPSIATRLDALPLDTAFQALVIQVECAMVLRVLSNPDGKLEEEGDDYRYRLDAARSTGALYVSDAELALLGAGDDQSDGAFTIKPAGFTDQSAEYDWITVGSGYL